MKTFAAPVDDILFILEAVAGASSLPGWDSDLASEVVSQFAKLAESEIAPIDAVGDMQGCRLHDGRVIMPDGFRQAYAHYAEQGWPGLAAPEQWGGQGLAAPLLGAVSEIFSGACHSLQMVTGLVPGAVRTLIDFGTEQQKETWLPRLASGAYLSTMCLTEPAAGSDLAGISTRAVDADGGWQITGSKIFISGGDQDLSEGIAHLVLARTGEQSEGTRGLSLFLCPSHDESGVRNTIKVDRIEEKMGLHASPTCQMSFQAARSEIIGQVGEGLKAMFTMMNHARLDVALQGVAHAARAHDIARTYAAERRQGRRPGDARQVPIDAHPDVARMLAEQDSLAIGSRALCHIALVALERGDNPDLMDFLTPVCKFACTEAGIRSADLAIQILGGYGYLREYRVEQTLRDARITAIYEGANGIHALTLATRLLTHRNGIAAHAFAAFIADVLEKAGNPDGLATCFTLWNQLRDRVLAAAEPADHADNFMRLTAVVAYQAVWEKIAGAAAFSRHPERLLHLAQAIRHDGPRQARYFAD